MKEVVIENSNTVSIDEIDSNKFYGSRGVDGHKYLYNRYAEFLRAVIIEVWRLNQFTKFKKLTDWFKQNVENI